MTTPRPSISSEVADHASVSKDKRRLLNDTDKGVLLIMALVILPVIAAAAIVVSFAS